jgi:hypothetical protein
MARQILIFWLLYRHNEPISFYKDVPEILHQIRGWKIDDALEGSDDDKVLIAACSRTDAPRL